MSRPPSASRAARTARNATRIATRGISALTALALLAPSAGALTPLVPPDAQPARFAPAVWAEAAPANAFARDRQALRFDQGARGAPKPGFDAPSASSCRREVRTHEQPGEQLQQIPSSVSIGRAGHARSGSAVAREADADAVALPAPASASAKVTDRAYAPKESAPSAGGSPAPVPAPPVAATTPATTAEDSLAIAPPAPPAPPARRANTGPVTAGMVDDNADFSEYLAFRDRTQVTHRAVNVRERVLLQVRDPRGQAVPDAEVIVRATNGTAMWARTDSAGRAWLSPDAFDDRPRRFYEVTARQGKAQASAVFQRGQKSAVDITLDARAPAQRARLDLVFLIDATGSMADEIAKLKATLRTIADDVAALPSRPDTCFSLVAYRDKTDAFLLRSHDFTGDLGAFQKVLDQLQADGGGDEPEAMNEALFEAVHALSWRGDGATRLMVLLADAPPHLDYEGPQYDQTMKAALGKGIKVFSVGASGLSKQGEFIQRQIAQYTGGRFVFLTYQNARNPASGPGRETVHDVNNYSVETLDRLIVRLVTDELAKLPQTKR